MRSGPEEEQALTLPVDSSVEATFLKASRALRSLVVKSFVSILCLLGSEYGVLSLSLSAYIFMV